MKLGGLQKMTLLDYPGKIACTVFTVGCMFRCPFCYNPELVLPEKIKPDAISEKDFFSFLDTRHGLIDGVVICGGEPTMHSDLPDFAKKIKDMGFDVKLDSNGSNPEMLKRLMKEQLIDYVAMDIKGPKEKYCQIAGIPEDSEMVKKIEQSVEILKNSNIAFEFRTTIVPGLLDKEDIINIAKWIQGVRKYVLQNFSPRSAIDPAMEKVKPYPDNYILEIKQEVSPFFKECEIR